MKNDRDQNKRENNDSLLCLADKRLRKSKYYKLEENIAEEDEEMLTSSYSKNTSMKNESNLGSSGERSKKSKILELVNSRYDRS